MSDLHISAALLSHMKIFMWGTCPYTPIVLDNHSLLQLDHNQTEEEESVLAAHEFSLLQESSR